MRPRAFADLLLVCLLLPCGDGKIQRVRAACATALLVSVAMGCAVSAMLDGCLCSAHLALVKWSARVCFRFVCRLWPIHDAGRATLGSKSMTRAHRATVRGPEGRAKPQNRPHHRGVSTASHASEPRHC